MSFDTVPFAVERVDGLLRELERLTLESKQAAGAGILYPVEEECKIGLPSQGLSLPDVVRGLRSAVDSLKVALNGKPEGKG